MPLPRFDKLAPHKQSTILEAALDEFAAKGFDGASFNQIVIRAGVSKGAIYYYFSDKEDLYLTVLERALAELSQIPLPTAVRSIDDYWQGVERLYRAVVAVIRRDPRVVRLLQGSVADLQRLTATPRLAPLLDGVRRQTSALLASGRAVGAVRSDVEDDFLIELTFAVGETLDHYMIASGELESNEGTERAIARGLDTLRRLLEPERV